MKTRVLAHATRLALAGLAATAAIDSRADVITQWNAKAIDIVLEAKLGNPATLRAMALTQTAVRDAVENAHGASVEAAVAAANRAVLAKLLPAQQAPIEAAYKAALAAVEDGPAKAAGLSVGEQAAASVLAKRADDVVAGTESYRPSAIAGAYVPTATPLALLWSTRKPWLLASADQLRPGAPPALASENWARDLNEVKDLGAKNSARRTAEQSEIARFWDYSLPPIYYGVVRSVAEMPGRDVARNARLYAAVTQAMDDALVSVFDAKYHYNFWRPVTAIRNADLDGNDATHREASWASLIDAPMHPEYPSGHSILAGSVGAVLKADLGPAASPTLVTTSPTAKGGPRRWSNPDEFVREVSDARVYGGIHYRTATEVGADMGRRIGEMAAARNLAQPSRLTQAR